MGYNKKEIEIDPVTWRCLMIRLFTITTLFLAFGCPIEATKRLDTFLPSSLKQNPYYQKGYQTARAMIASPQNILAHEKQMQNDIDELKPHLEMAETSEEFKRAFQKIKAYASGVMDFTKEFNWELHLEKRNIVLTADNKAFASKLIAMSNALFTSIIEAENKADFKEKFEHLLLHTWSPFLREITKPSKKLVLVLSLIRKTKRMPIIPEAGTLESR